MATQNNLHVPDEILAQARKRAESEGRTADELAADALKRYLAHQMLNELSKGSDERRRARGLKSDDEAQEYVQQVISDSRKERRVG
jgi:hypothetical protein